MSAEYIDADHWWSIDLQTWPYKSFSPQELACRGTGAVHLRKDALQKLQRLRTASGGPLIINSAYRSPKHNASVGGAKNSQHVQGIAFDVSMVNHDPGVFEASARAAGFTGFGFYPPGKGNFIHIDLGPAREWGMRWEAQKHDPEPRDKRGGKAVGIATLTSMGAGAMQAVNPDTLKQVQEVVTPMIAYAPIFSGLFAACGFGIVGWMLWDKFIKRAP